MEKNKQRSKRNKKILAAAGALACVALLAGTYAWLQSEDNKTNKFTGVLSGNDVTITEQWKEPESWTPGQEVTKKVGIMNTGEYDEFIRVSFKEALALLTNTTVQESPTLPTIVPSFFDPINPETAFYGFAVEFNTNENGKLDPKQPVLKNAKTTNSNNDLAAFVKFLNAYYKPATPVTETTFKTTGSGTAKDPYKLDYKTMGMENPAPNAGWLIPVSQTTIDNLTETTGSNWKEANFTGGTAPTLGGYTLVAYGSPVTQIKNPNNGETEYIRDYKFYWQIKNPLFTDATTTPDEPEYLYFQSAGINNTKTTWNTTALDNSTVEVLDTPKIAYISAAYEPTQEKQWWASTNPANNEVGQLFVPWKLDAGQSDAGSYANQTFAEALKRWWVNSNVKVTSQNNPTKTKAEIAIDFVNMSQTVPEATDTEDGKGKKGSDVWYYNEADGFFYYCNIVKSGETTAQIIDKVKLENGAGNEYTKLHYNLDVKTEAIQAIGEAAKDEWNVTGPLLTLYNTIGNTQNP